MAGVGLSAASPGPGGATRAGSTPRTAGGAECFLQPGAVATPAWESALREGCHRGRRLEAGGGKWGGNFCFSIFSSMSDPWPGSSPGGTCLQSLLGKSRRQTVAFPRSSFASRPARASPGLARRRRAGKGRLVSLWAKPARQRRPRGARRETSGSAAAAGHRGLGRPSRGSGRGRSAELGGRRGRGEVTSEPHQMQMLREAC